MLKRSSRASSRSKFTLHPQLAQDTIEIGDLPLSRLLLMNNRRFPWLILVPRAAEVREIFELPESHRQQLMLEISSIAHVVSTMTGAFKMNIAALGNQVPQLHVHIIARFEGDAAWPNPVWNGGLQPQPYTPQESAQILEKLRALLNITKM